MELYNITSKFELNILDGNTNPIVIADWAQKQRCPAIVAAPQYIAPLMANRAAKYGQYLIIATLDFPAGKSFAMEKMRDVTDDFRACDGCDILLTGKRTQIETKNEIKALYDFLRAVGMLEIRFTLGAYSRSREEIINMLLGMVPKPPRWIRVDQHLAMPNIDTGHHKAMVGLIKEHMPTPLKISCNVNLDTVNAFKDTKARFDVTYQQAVNIVKQHEEELKAEQQKLIGANSQ